MSATDRLGQTKELHVYSTGHLSLCVIIKEKGVCLQTGWYSREITVKEYGSQHPFQKVHPPNERTEDDFLNAHTIESM